MTNLSNPASTFPNHAYDFGDHVYVKTIRQGGVVDGIWQQPHGIVYHVLGLSGYEAIWWPESQLQDACPTCLKPWVHNRNDACVHCGYVQPFD